MVKNKILKRIVAGLSCIALSTTMLTSYLLLPMIMLTNINITQR